MLRDELTGIELRDDEQTRKSFGRDESDMGEYLPELVAFPTSSEEVQRIVRACVKHNVPVTPAGARTGKSGGVLPIKGGLSLSLTKMNRIVAIRPDDLTATVQPGVVLADFQRAVDELGLFYPPDPNSAPTCTLGGNIACNAGGPSALKYGVTREYVLGLEWVLPSGELIHVGRQTMKGVVGYDLTALFVGSEGTLGIATEIIVKLLPKPPVVMTALLPFTEVAAAARAVNAILQGGVLPKCLELLDDVALMAIKGQGIPFHDDAKAVLIVELDGSSDEGVFADLNRVAGLAKQHGSLDAQLAVDRDQRERIWATRKAVSPALRALKKFKFSEDIVVPRSKIPEAIERFKEIGKKLKLTVATYGHAGDGNLHTNVLYAGPHERPQVDLALAEIMKETVALGGTISGEHGVGLTKQQFVALEQSAPLIALQKQLKAMLDPACLFNPGKLFPRE